MAVHGSIDHRILGGGSGFTGRMPINEAFTGLYNFLTSSYAQSVGIQQIAYNTGSGGTGMGWWDSATPSGENAWACFKFASASIPFYMLIQYNNSDTSNSITGQSFGTAPGSPAQLGAGASYVAGLGIQFAMDDNGGNVWNGTVLNNGQDNKGTIVWMSGSATGSLFVFPRSNSAGGSHATQRQNMFPMVQAVTSNVNGIKQSGARVHILVDQNNFMYLHDIAYDGSYQVTYFGKYDVRPDITSSLPPYLMIGYKTENTNPTPNYALSTIYGTTAGNTDVEGGIIMPLTAAYGANNGQQGVKGMSIDLVPNFLFDGRFHPNSTFSPAKYDVYPAFVALNESPIFGFLGRINFFSMCYGLPSHATDSTKTRAVFGANNQAAAKMVVPWDGLSSPGQSADRYGRQF